MIDSVQLVLLLVIIILTILLVILGVQVFLILTDLRKTIRKANRVLDNASHITSSVSGPIATVSSLVGGLKSGSLLTVARVARNLLTRESDESSHHHHKD